jgi:hypothetical protein
LKIRAFILIAIIIGGSYMMLDSFKEKQMLAVNELPLFLEHSYVSLHFNKPKTSDSLSKTWVVDEESEIQALLQFLQKYHVRKINPNEIDTEDDVEQFSIRLIDQKGDQITILIDENLIIQNSILYYEIVDGPLDVDWLVHFFVSNQS